MMRRLICLLSSSVLILSTGCVSKTTYHKDVTNLPADHQAELLDEVIPVRGAQARDWGLALSGGGIRSGAFCMGVLKGLSDRELLGEIDVVSVVSGGGYAWHWMRAQNDYDKAFGASVFQQGEWMQKNVQLAFSAKFSPHLHWARQAFRSRASGICYYEQQLDRLAYASLEPGNTDQPEPPSPARMVDFFADRVKRAKLPATIIVTTINTSERSPADIVEITDTHVGNRHFGYRPWSEDNRIPLVKAVAMSGAAVPEVLAQHWDDPIQGSGQTMTIWDGGGGPGAVKKKIGENLGAYSLIIRGISNVIIVDAEMDPGYGFGAYYRLRELLAADQITLSVPEIDERPAGPYFSAGPVLKGRAQRCADTGLPAIDVQIHYIKLSLPDSLFKPGTRPNGKPGLFSTHERNAVAVDEVKQRSKDATVPTISGRRSFVSARVKDIKPTRCLPAFYGEVVARYATYLNHDWSSPLKHLLKGDVANYTFPHITTGEQSFYHDQFEAYVGLGYLHAIALGDLKKIEQNTDEL